MSEKGEVTREAGLLRATSDIISSELAVRDDAREPGPITAGVNELAELAEWYIWELVGLVALEDEGDMLETGVGRAWEARESERAWSTDGLRETLDAAVLGDGLAISGAEGGETERGRGAGERADLKDRVLSVSEESKTT